MMNVDTRNEDAEGVAPHVPTAHPPVWRTTSRHRACRHVGVAAAAIALLAGCSSLTNLTGGDSTPPPPAPSASSGTAPPSSNSSFTSRVRSFFSGDSPSLGAVAAASGPAAPEIECPSVEYRQGAATLAVNAPGSENAALGLRYQASFVQTARECVVRGGDLTIKVGVQGRIVVGPAGGPGQIAIPLRYALVREGMQPRTLWTKLFMVPAAIPDGQLNLPWLHVEEEMTVPLPSSTELEAYVIYIGFDPDGAAQQRPAKPAPKPKTARSR
jgi:hypothetical protein